MSVDQAILADGVRAFRLYVKINMSKDYKLDILVGSNIGTFKHVRFDSNPKNKNCILQLQNIKEIEKNWGITCTSWFDSEQTKILVGRKNRTVQTFDFNTNGFVSTQAIDFGEGNLNSLSAYENKIIGAVDSGIVKLWKPNKHKGETINTGGPIDKMKLNVESKTIATGGNENNLKLWDLETKSMKFHAKNVPHDWLELRVPIWVSGICYLPGNDGKLLAICSRYGVVRLYDERAQRRPVCSVELLENQAGSCISAGHRERNVIVGTGRGRINLVDLRMKGKVDKSYKGAVGAISEVEYCPKANVVISTSLDRHLRIHDADTKDIIYKQYLTSKLTTLTLRTSETCLFKFDDVTVKEELPELPEEECNSDDYDQEYEDMFNKMETIEDKSNKLKQKRKITDEAKPIKTKKKKTDEVVEESPVSVEDNIKRLLKNTEKQKKKLEKERKKKKSKSLFYK